MKLRALHEGISKRTYRGSRTPVTYRFHARPVGHKFFDWLEIGYDHPIPLSDIGTFEEARKTAVITLEWAPHMRYVPIRGDFPGWQEEEGETLDKTYIVEHGRTLYLIELDHDEAAPIHVGADEIHEWMEQHFVQRL